MGLFGKKSLTEIEVAGQFVLAVAEGVHQQWPEIVNELKRTLQPEDPISDDRYAGFEFSLAVIAVEIQALPDLLPSDQASRIREFVCSVYRPRTWDRIPARPFKSTRMLGINHCSRESCLFVALPRSCLTNSSAEIPCNLGVHYSRIRFSSWPWERRS